MISIKTTLHLNNDDRVEVIAEFEDHEARKAESLHDDLVSSRIHDALSILDDYGLPTHISEDDVASFEVEFESDV